MRKLTAVLLTLVMIFSCAFACAEEGTEASESMIGIISAVQKEVDLLLSKAEIDHVDTVGGVDFNVGRLCGHPAVIAKAGVGKVLAASGVTAMLNRYPVSKVIFTGVAGGVRDETKVMDMVIGTKLIQHDYGQYTEDGFEWFAGTNGEADYCDCDPELIRIAYDAAVSELGEEHVFKGVIASGDQFIASETYVQKLQEDFDALACEMEGAAIATVCKNYEIPFVVIRCMSDKADGKAHEAYENLVEDAANQSGRVVLRMLEAIPTAEKAIPAADIGKHVVILATSDMHGNIWGWSYEDSQETTNSGMARLYTYIRKVREENPDAFLIDGGDELQGNILTDDIASKEPEAPHPAIAAMNMMGYDTMTLGNHEFDWGVPKMKQMLSTAEFPVLCENIRTGDGELLTGTGWTIIERGGIRLAVIGVDTPMIPLLDSGKEGVDGLIYEAASTAVGQAIREIGDQADIIMVSAHMGMEAQFDEDGGTDSARKILEDNPEVDVLQVAHMHITVNQKEGHVPVGGVRASAREIARFDLTLDENGNITDSAVTIVDMADYEPCEEIREIPVVRDAHEKTIALVSAGGDGEEADDTTPPIGWTTAKFQPENEIKGLPEGRLQDTAVMDLILRVEAENAGADVAASAMFKDASDLPEGAIYYRNILDIYKYDNGLYRVTVTGKELKAYMEWAVECYNQWVPGDINISFDPDSHDYLHDMFSGVYYEINLSKPKGERIENVLFHGEPLRDDETLTLAVNNFRYASTLKTYNIVAGKRDWESYNSVRDMIVEYFQQHSPVAPEVDHNWQITGIDLNKEDPRRAEIIGYINEGLLPVPYNKSYNLADYESLKAQAEENRRNRDAAPEEMSDDPSDEIAITVGDEKISAAELKDEIRLELIRSALECAGYGYEYDTVDPENIADRADIVAFDLELRAVVQEQARKLGADVLTPEAEEAVEKEVQETWDRYTAIARSDNGMAFLPAGEYEPVEGNPEETLERYFASFGLTKDTLRRIAAAEQTDTQVETVVIAGKGLKTRDEIIDYYTDWILERYDEMNPVRNNDVINRVIQELAGEGAFSAIAGDWYEDEIMMSISNTGRFVVGWNDGDWTGTLEAEQITNTEGEEITAYRMISDDPKANSWENPELVPDIYYPGKLTLTRDGTPVDTFFNAPVRVEDMAGEDLANYEPYTLIDNTGGEDGAAIFMLTLLRPARDVAVMQMYNQGFDDEGTFGYDGDTLEWWAAVDSRTQIVVKHMFEGDLPELSISFIAEDDTSYNFAVEISGGNGEMILTPLEPLNG